MTNDEFEHLARRAAAGDETARNLLRGDMTPELLDWMRRQLTEEEMESAREALREMREKGGLELKDFIQELEQMVP